MNLAQQGRERVSILDVGDRNLAFDRQPERIDRQVALAAFDFLGRVEAARSARFRRFDRLAVDDHRRGRRLTPFGLAGLHHQKAENLRP